MDTGIGKYKKAYCKMLITHFEQGLSYESFAGVIGVSSRVLYDWEKAHKEFKEAKEIGVAKSQIFWEKMGIENIISEKGSSMNASVWIFNMKNRFKWRDKQPDESDVVVNNFAKMSDEDLDAEIASLMTNYQKEKEEK